ncbi:hypothetical protein [Falsiroseomonas sp.]|uniref:hypothetical protein n=1 Tax=Falsiroseomonas sp. TaxID=2870721 RepID=UPI0034A1AF52
MTMNTHTEAKTPADAAQQDVAQASGAKAEAAATASDELSEDDLEAVAGGTAKTPEQLEAFKRAREIP